MKTDRERIKAWPDRIRRFAVSVLLVFLVLFVWLRATAVRGVDRFGNTLVPDFTQFYVAGQLAAAGEINRVYDEAFFESRVNALLGLPREAPSYPFLYPPVVPWLMVPVSWLPYAMASWLELGAMALLAAVLARGITRTLLSDEAIAQSAAWLFLASIPAIRCLLYGQNGFVSLAIVWGGFLLWRKDREVAAALVFSLGAYKPQLFLGVWLWWLLAASWRGRAAFMLGGLAWFAIGTAMAGHWSIWKEWLAAVARMHDSTVLQGQQVGWFGLERWWPSAPTLASTVWWSAGAVLLLGSGIVIIRLCYRGGRAGREAAFFLALWGGCWLAPRMLVYDLVMLFPAWVWLWDRAAKEKRKVGIWERVCIISLIIGCYLGDFFALIKLPLLTILGVSILVTECLKRRHVYDRMDTEANSE